MLRWLIKNRRKILFSLVILMAFLAAVELLARWWLAGYAQRKYGIDIDQYQEVELVVDEGHGWKWGGKVIFRGLREVSFAKPPGLYRIITTGDSCCWGAMVAADATFSARLEVLLRDKHGPDQVEVLNAGVVGYGTEQVTQLTRETLAHFAPDLIVYYGTGEEAAKWVVGGYESIVPELERFHRLFFYSKAFLALNHLVRKLHKPPPPKSRLIQNDDLNDLQRAVEEIGARLMLVEYLYVPRGHDYLTSDLVGRGMKFRVPVVRTYPAFKEINQPVRKLMFDDVHPTPLGHAIIAGCIRDEIERLDPLDKADTD